MSNNSIKKYKELRSNLKLGPISGPVIRVAVLGDTATQFLCKAIRGQAYEAKLNLQLWQADYDQIDLQINDPDSTYYQSDNDYTILYKSSKKLLKKYYASKNKLEFSRKFLSSIEQLIVELTAKSGTAIIIANLVEIPDLVFSNYANTHKASWLYQLRLINMGLMELSQMHAPVRILDLNIIQTEIGRRTFFDPVNHTRSDAVISLEALPLVSKSIIDMIASSSGKMNKCLILDLDNTMWGGIIGDDGLEKIQVGDLGLGKVFTELQLWAKNLKERGVILCVCSKNTESVAKEPFENHPYMILRLEDISVFVANWESKADNIRYIQSVLNIGFDSMVFLDDNPFERNLVRTELPDVLVPELPKDPAFYLPSLNSLNLFETTTVSDLDKDRTKQYQTEAKRVVFQKSQGSLMDYLKNLEMTAVIAPFDKFHTPRIAQLTQRSNQFNLRTIRYSEQQIKELSESKSHICRYVKLRDKFGDNGLISVVVLKKLGDREAAIDTWIMSCRVLKRDVEKFVLNELVKLCIEDDIHTLRGERIPTAKNVLVKDHYKNLGFAQDGEEQWSLLVNDYKEKKHFVNKES